MATPRPVHGLEDRNPTRSPNTPTARARNLMDGAHGYPLLLFSRHPAMTANWLVNSPIRILAPHTPHRSQPGLQAAVISLDSVVGVLGGVVVRSWQEL
jgi:hypothetical protein